MLKFCSYLLDSRLTFAWNYSTDEKLNRINSPHYFVIAFPVHASRAFLAFMRNFSNADKGLSGSCSCWANVSSIYKVKPKTQNNTIFSEQFSSILSKRHSHRVNKIIFLKHNTLEYMLHAEDYHDTYLKVKDNCPDQAQNNGWLSISNVRNVNIYQFDLKTNHCLSYLCILQNFWQNCP
jgi:hypothetical protein